MTMLRKQVNCVEENRLSFHEEQWLTVLTDIFNAVIIHWLFEDSQRARVSLQSPVL